ncbi:MAG: hypothetical protein U5J64_10280 [Halobacteriales archaeon]|nr:hypothetical protein [Halobacteriales archaeon]
MVLRHLDGGQRRTPVARNNNATTLSGVPFERPTIVAAQASRRHRPTACPSSNGTGTTSLAALVAGRNSVGYEIEEEFTEVFDERVSEAPEISRDVVRQRLEEHREFVEEKLNSGDDFEYEAENYDFPVTTKQEKSVQFYRVDCVEKTSEGYRASHLPVEET